VATELDAENEEEQFRPVHLKYLKGKIQENFEIFYKTESFGNIQFVKLVSADPENQDKAQKLIAEKEGTEDFFIRKEDIGKYFNQATSQLRDMMADPNIPLLEKTKKAYEVSKDLMQDFFVLNGSVATLKSTNGVVEVMGECLSDADANFHSIFTITAKNYYTYTHSVNVGLYCLAYGVKTGMNDEDIRDLGLGGMLHDVGKSRVDPKILNKNSGLTHEEFSQAKDHSAYGQEMLEAVNCFSTRIVEMAGLHHEKYDGTGYPKGLAGKDIPHFARICKVADVYDALTTHRSYKRAMTPYDALIVMGKKMKNEFDLDVLGNFIRFMGPNA
jgi:HD-GYP domain-containing protein (c-di-GMP phosphodiesterase class II)